MSLEEVAEILKAKDTEIKREWEMLRKQCYYTVATHSEITEEVFNLKNFPLSWDKKQVRPSNKKEFKKKANKVDKWLARNQ